MIEQTIEVIRKLKRIIIQCNIDGLETQITQLDSLEEVLLNEIALTQRQKITVYNQLFPPRGGLSEINYWNEDFELRRQINKQLHNLKNQIANYLLSD